MISPTVKVLKMSKISIGLKLSNGSYLTITQCLQLVTFAVGGLNHQNMEMGDFERCKLLNPLTSLGHYFCPPFAR